MTERIPTITSIDGKFVKPAEARVSVFDNSLLYAEGLFETFLVIGDHIVFLDDHLKRLLKGTKVVGLNLPVTLDTLKQWMKKTIRKHPDRIKRLRMTITAGESARWVGQQGTPRVILSVAAHNMPVRPYRLLVSPFRVDQDSVFRRVKTISYAINAAAYKQASVKGFDDALLLNEQDQVAEVTSANIFWINNGTVYTPPLSSGCLEGVTRKIVLRESKKLDIPVVEANCTLSDLSRQNEIFITSSLKLVIGVDKIRDGRRVHSFSDRDITGRFAERFYEIAGI